LHDYLTLVPEAIAALEVRESALNLLFTLQDELASKQAQLEAASKVGHIAAVLELLDAQFAYQFAVKPGLATGVPGSDLHVISFKYLLLAESP
jgi:hypothetical protein